MRLSLKRFSLFFGLFIGSVASLWAAAPADIQVDQTGYLTNETKLAMVTNAAATGTFYVVSTSGPTTVYTGALSTASTDTNTGLSVRDADFSTVTATGTYYLQVAGLGQSYNFSIGPNVFSNAFYETMRFYTGQRCGTALTIVNAGTTWTHGICHAPGAADGESDGTFDASSGKSGFKSSTKGWHDAGDYGKYIVNANISVGELLWTYEWYSSVLNSFNLNLPESGNGTPDVLNECKWELDWMLTMQDTDGGVWAKLSSGAFPSFVMPENDDATGNRLIIGTNNGSPYKDSGATAGFAAVMAIASRLYQPYNAAYATTCLNAAVSAWNWVQTNPASYTTANPTGITTGTYGDGGATSTPSYRLWAAAELYRTTGTAAYDTYFTTNYTTFSPLISGTQYPQDWTDTKNLAYWSYYFTGKNNIQTVTAAVTTAIYNATINSANTIVTRQNADGYRVSLQTSDYIWGSNGGVGNYGVLLLMANAMNPTASYQQAVYDDIHYLLGRNGNKISFVTDLGSIFQMHPHHRPSAADGITLPWPGMLAGGPNKGGGDGGLTPTGNPAALCYADVQGAYASNEEAVNWNAPLVFILGSTLQASAPTATPTSTASNTPTGTPTPTATKTSTATPSQTATQTQTASPTKTPTVTQTDTASSSPTFSATSTPTASTTATPTPTLTASPSATPTRTTTSTFSSTATSTLQFTATNTATATPTSSPTKTVTATTTSTPTASATQTPSGTPTATLQYSATNTASSTPSATATNSGTSSMTSTPTASATQTPSGTPTATLQYSATNTASSTATASATRTPTETASATATLTATRTPSGTPTPTLQYTATNTATSTPTSSSTMTLTPTPTSSPTRTATSSPSSTPSFTPASSTTATPTSTATPGTVNISSVYPNPIAFDGGPVWVDLTLPGPAHFRWSVFTTAFRKIAWGDSDLSGSQTFGWDLKDHTGVPAARGLYYLRLELSGDFGKVQKIRKVLIH